MPEQGWVPIANTAARDHTVSWKARGLLAELLSYPDGWETDIDKLVEKARRAGGKSEGRESMRGAMAELEAAGYVTRTRTSGGRGKWVTAVAVSDVPAPRDRRTAFRASAGRASDNRASADWASLDRQTMNTVKNTDNKSSASLTSFAAAEADASAANYRKHMLNAIWSTIDKLNDADRRRHLFTVEKRRPRIYREARRHAIGQVGRDSPQALKTKDAAGEIDLLSYKYVAMHYVDTAGDLPLWLARPLRWEPARYATSSA